MKLKGLVVLSLLSFCSTTIIIKFKEQVTEFIGGIPTGCHCIEPDNTGQQDDVTTLLMPGEGSTQNFTTCGQIQCESLDVALSYSSSMDVPVTVIISNGTHKLSYSHRFTKKTKVDLKGQNSVVKCEQEREAGLAFIESTNISISSITFVGCATKHLICGREFQRYNSTFVALYFHNCKDIKITEVGVEDTLGTGLLMLNTTGENVIRDSQISRCKPRRDSEEIGGGGMRIVLTDTISSSTSYKIVRTNFTGNNASSPNFPTSPNIEIDSTSLITFGMGGGLFVCLGAKTSNISVEIDTCWFQNNTANKGGGLSVLLLDQSQDNNIIITNSSFSSNKCTAQILPPSLHVSGGGVSLLFFATSQRNSVTMTKSNFTGNNAYYGGGLSMITGKQYDDKLSVQDKNHFNLTGCYFEHNVGRIGAAVDFYCKPFPAETKTSCSVSPLISDTKFTKNCGKYIYNNNTATGRTFATLNIQYVSTKLEGSVIFRDNDASGIGIQDSKVSFQKNSNITFTGNIGKIGGGMALFGKTTVILNSNTRVIFESNAASESGGAIFVSQSSQERYIAYDYTCFFQHSNSSLHPNKWDNDNINISFSGNKAAFGTPNVIFASSILPCVWPNSVESPVDHVESDINDTFCHWDSWHFDKNVSCWDLITTASARFSQMEYNVSVFPGHFEKINNFSALDDFNHDVTRQTQFTVWMDTDTKQSQHPANNIHVTSDGEIMVTGEENTHLSGILQSANSRSASTILRVHVMPCPIGTHWSKDQNTGSTECSCRQISFHGNLRCNQLPLIVSLFIGHCIGNINNTNTNDSKPELVVARCPYLLSKFKTGPFVNVAHNGSNFCKQVNRQGTLCGKCIEGYGINIYSPTFDCVNCNKVKPYFQWLKVVLITVIPITIFFIVVTVFHIGVTSAAMNGYIFFSNIMTVSLQVLILDAAWTIQFQNDQNQFRTLREALNGALLTPYRIWNLEFPQIVFFSSRTVCLHESLRVVHVLALKYLPAFYPLFLVIVTYILIELQARNCKPLVWLWRPLCYLCVRFRNNWELRTSIIDAFATFLLLSYSRLVSVSIGLLAPNKVYNATDDRISTTLHYDTSVRYFDTNHLPFAAIAIIVLLTFGAIPPLLLILYPFQWFQKVLNCCKINRVGLRVFVDAFQGSFKNGTDGTPERRYFAGVYFLFRIIILLIYSLPVSLPRLYLILTSTYITFIFIIVLFRPYKDNYYNILDVFFLAILAATSCLLMYAISFVMAFQKLPHPAWEFAYTLAHIPTLYIIAYFFYWICTHSRLVQRYIKPRVSRLINIITCKNDPYNDHNITESDRLIEELSPQNENRRLTASNFSVNSQDMQEFPDQLEYPYDYYNNGDLQFEDTNNYNCGCCLLLRSDREREANAVRQRIDQHSNHESITY